MRTFSHISGNIKARARRIVESALDNKARARRIVESALDKRGYALKDKSMPPRGFEEFTKYLRARRFDATTVIDVGVGTGTPWLYEAFPDARFELFEVLD